MQGSQNQLKEVWEEADGLDPEDFDPKTFFNLHGTTFTELSGGMGAHSVHECRSSSDPRRHQRRRLL